MNYETNAMNAAGAGATQVVVGLFTNGADAHKAVTQLRANGFTSDQIGAAFRSASRGPYSTSTKADTRTGAVKQDAENWWEKVKDAFRPEDKVENRREVAAGSTVDSDSYATGRHPRGGEDEYDYADDLEPSLAETGISSSRAAYLSRNLQSGGAIVTVRDTERIAEAEHILSSNHGKVRHEDADAATGLPTASANDSAVGFVPQRSEYAGQASVQEPADIDAAAATDRETTDAGLADKRPVESANTSIDRVQLFGEVLRVHKERVIRGEARLRKDVVTEDQTIEVPVTREELVLERVAVSPDTPASSASIGQSKEIRVPLAEETVSVEKQPVVREEVLVGKREVQDVARVGDKVRREELHVDSPKRKSTGEPAAGEDVRRHG